MLVDGRCHCGSISYEAEVDPEKVMICHCADCQTLSGSAFRTVVLTRGGSFRLVSGELKIYTKTGAKRHQAAAGVLPGLRHADLLHDRG